MAKIKALVMDVDGTLTDGKIYISEHGELMKAFNIKDGYAIARLGDYGIIPVIITGRKSQIVDNRCKELGITKLYQGIANKVDKIKEVADELQISLDEISYIGDDLNDLGCISICGFTGCPSDAVEEIRNAVDYVCKECGGDGAVRSFIRRLIFI